MTQESALLQSHLNALSDYLPTVIHLLQSYTYSHQ